jgi:hypothetical protein
MPIEDATTSVAGTAGERLRKFELAHVEPAGEQRGRRPDDEGHPWRCCHLSGDVLQHRGAGLRAHRCRGWSDHGYSLGQGSCSSSPQRPHMRVAVILRHAAGCFLGPLSGLTLCPFHSRSSGRFRFLLRPACRLPLLLRVQPLIFCTPCRLLRLGGNLTQPGLLLLGCVPFDAAPFVLGDLPGGLLLTHPPDLTFGDLTFGLKGPPGLLRRLRRFFRGDPFGDRSRRPGGCVSDPLRLLSPLRREPLLRLPVRLGLRLGFRDRSQSCLLCLVSARRLTCRNLQRSSFDMPPFRIGCCRCRCCACLLRDELFGVPAVFRQLLRGNPAVS